MMKRCKHLHSACGSSRHCTVAQRIRPALARVRSMSSKYDHPALYSNDDAFWERSYWDKRYQQDPTTFEWYQSYSSLQPILSKHFPKDGHILQLGVGTSRLQVDMADDGYSHIKSIDYSPVAIQRLQQLYTGYDDRLFYAVADARSMPQYPDGTFAGVLDKGTLDALLCGDTDEADAAAVLGEVWRLLTPGAAYVMITSASPRARLGYLQTTATPWSQLLVYEVGQQGAMTGPFSCSRSSSRGSSAGSQTASNSGGGLAVQPESAAAGPDSATGDEADQLEQAMQLPQMGYSHLAYVCYK